MSNLDHRSDFDYTAYLVRIQAGTFEEALSGSGLAVPPRTAGFSQAPACAPQPTDYFTFYQENGRWAWRRVSDTGAVVAVSSYTFRYYLECTADAKQHGWEGMPLFIFAGSGAALA
jgi:hypothetical protein